MPIAGEVAIIGSATTAFGVHHERGYLDLLAEAAFGAVADAGPRSRPDRLGVARDGRARADRASSATPAAPWRRRSGSRRAP